jgi:predicted type IV restriction endonuclease
VSEEYELARRSLEQLASWYEANSSTRNEATTRLQLIDRLFFDCLGWSKNDVVVEESQGGEYADYVFSLLRRVMIVEAKRESDYFELPAGHQRLEYSIPALRRDFPSVRQAVDQAAGYCQSRGVPFGAVSNGHQIIAFVATRSDGSPPLEGNALVFDSLESMVSDFLELWQALSKPGVEERKLFYRLVGGAPALPPKLSATLTNYPGLKSRNVIQTDLQILSEIVIEDVIRSPEIEPRFLRECYCQSGALSQFALSSREILTARYSALFDSERQGPSTVSATTKNGISPELLGISVARRPILLIGDVGVGKTTFIRHLVNVAAPDVFQNALFFHLDLGSKGALAVDLRLHVLDEIQRQLLEEYRTDITQRNFVRGVYDLQLKQFAAGIYGDLRISSPDTFLAKELDYLESLMGNRESHLKHSLSHIAKGRLKQVIVFLDNADQRDEQTQELAFLIAQEFAETWQVVVFVALRPETFHRSKAIGALTGYHPKAFTIAPPRIDLVLKKRLEFALALTTGKIPISTLQKVGLNLGKLTTIVRVVRRSLDENERIIEFIENIAAGNVRLALDLVRAFIGSGHVDTQKILAIEEGGGHYEIPAHEFLRAIIYGDGEYYDPATSTMVNLFDISTLDGKEHFLLPLALGLLHRATGPGVKEGFVDTGKIYDSLQAMGFTAEQIDFGIARACKKNLIETSARHLPEPGQRFPTALRITTRGEYHLQRLACEFPYLDAVVVDVPFLDREIRDEISHVDTLPDRLKRVELFAGYLRKQWSPLAPVAVGFNWNYEMGRLSRQINGIRRPRHG